MWKILGLILVVLGVAGVLYSWIGILKEREGCLEEFLVFLKKALFAMKTEKVKVIDFFAKYNTKDALLEEILKEVAGRLSTNTYPNGQMVWEEVFREEEQNLNFDHEVIECIVQAGNGFFGRSRAENISFLEKSIKELEKQLEKMKEKNIQERKVWLPVGMLGALMLVIILL